MMRRIRCGVMLRHVVERGLGRERGVDLVGGHLHAALVVLERGIALGEKRVDVGVAHLVVLELRLVGVVAEPELAVRSRQEVALEPVGIGLRGLDRGGVALDEQSLLRGIGRAGDERRHEVPEERDQPLRLADRDLGEDVWRIGEVRARVVEYAGHEREPRVERLEARVDGREVALDEAVHRARDDARVVVRVVLPAAHGVELEHVAVELGHEHRLVDAPVERELGGRELLRAREVGTHVREPRRDRRFVRALELAVEHVHADAGRERGPRHELLGEPVVHHGVERAIVGAQRGFVDGRAVGRQRARGRCVGALVAAPRARPGRDQRKARPARPA